MDELERHRLERVGLNRHLRQIHQLHAELFGEQGQHNLFLEETALDQHFVQGAVGRGGLGLGHKGEVFFLEQTLVHQLLQKLHAILGDGSG